MTDAIRYAIGCGAAFVLVVFGVYVLVRTGATAWYRTKREHAHRLMRDMKGESENDG